MSLLVVCQDVADMIGLARPTAIATSMDQISRQMLAFCKETLDELARMDWPGLEIPYSFPTVVNQSAYSVPTDFGREVGDTAYIATQYYSLRGSLTPGDWSRQKNALPSQIGRYKFRIYGYPSKINIYPTPLTVETVVFEYSSTAKVRQADGTAATTYAFDTDVPVVPEELVKKGLKWRLKRAKGLDYAEEFNDYEMSRAMMLAQALALGSMPVAYRAMIDNPEIPQGYVPEFGYGS